MPNALDLPSPNILKIGYCEISPSLEFSVPAKKLGMSCRVFRRIDYARSRYEGKVNRTFQLQKDGLYRIHNVPGLDAHVCISTLDGVPSILSEEELKTAEERVFPAGFALARAKQEEEEHQRELRDRRRLSHSARVERNTVLAAIIEEDGQRGSDYPPLSGTPKQIAWAIEIRKEFARQHPTDRVLRNATRAKYWIENHRHIFERRRPTKTL